MCGTGGEEVGRRSGPQPKGAHLLLYPPTALIIQGNKARWRVSIVTYKFHKIYIFFSFRPDNVIKVNDDESSAKK